MLAQTKWVAAAMSQCVRLGLTLIVLIARIAAVCASWYGDYLPAIYLWLLADTLERALERWRS